MPETPCDPVLGRGTESLKGDIHLVCFGWAVMLGMYSGVRWLASPATGGRRTEHLVNAIVYLGLLAPFERHQIRKHWIRDA